MKLNAIHRVKGLWEGAVLGGRWIGRFVRDRTVHKRILAREKRNRRIPKGKRRRVSWKMFWRKHKGNEVIAGLYPRQKRRQALRALWRKAR